MSRIKKGDPVEFTRQPVSIYKVGDGEFGIAVENEQTNRTVRVELADGTIYPARHIHAFAWGGWLPDDLEAAYAKHNPEDCFPDSERFD